MVSLLAAHERSVSRHKHMKTWVRNEDSGEVVDVNIQGSVETKGGGQRGDYLGNEPIEILVGRTLNIEGSTACVVKSLVIKIEGEVRVLKKTVSREHSIVRLNNGGRDLRRGSHGEAHLGLAAEVNGETLEKKRSETRSGSSSSGMEDKESLKGVTVVTHLTDLINDSVDDILSNGVVTTGVVIGGILLSTDDRLRVVELTVVSGTDGITYGWLKIDHNGTGYVLSVLGLAEEGVVSRFLASNGGISINLSILSDAMLEAVKFPA
mmetsp:Transcript_9318/g.13469  ORF Transcript_9318/g.13469 Transcript_9318/m.13469 type:complete len:265 (-) Transcript_9318:109-903(-)